MAALRELVQSAERHGVPLVFDCDDLVFDVRFAELVMSSLGKDVDVNAEWDDSSNSVIPAEVVETRPAATAGSL